MVNASNPPPKHKKQSDAKRVSISNKNNEGASGQIQPLQSTSIVDKVKTPKKVVRTMTKPLPKGQQLKAYMMDPTTKEKEGSESGSEPGSDLEVGSQQVVQGKSMMRARSQMQSNITLSSESSTSKSSSSITLSSGDSLGSSIHKFRDDFEEFKCKMKIFGESLNLCKCIASDFKARLTTLEGKLYGLEKRQRINKTRNNYTDIIKKNKELETKTQAFVLKMQKCGTEDEMREVAGRICKNYLHGLWKVAHAQELKFKKITGGLSNFIYVIGLPDDLKPLYERIDEMDEEEVKTIQSEVGDEPKQVLLRIYGQVHGERAMDAIVTESVIFTLLSERRLGPKLFGVFSGGRIEEYIPARALVTRELAEPAISMKIAEKTAAIHSMDIPLSKEPNYIWKTMYKWLKTVKEECFNNGIKGKNETEQNAIKRLKEMNYDHEIEWLKKYLLSFDSPVVFCHNDLQEGNILFLEGEAACEEEEPTDFGRSFHAQQMSSMEHDRTPRGSEDGSPPSLSRVASPAWLDDHVGAAQSRAAFISQTHQSRAKFLEEDVCEDTVLSEPAGEPKLYLIDFEYCAYNYRAFDIANHFQEWAYDYTNPEHPFYFERQEDWPTLEQKEIFIREYLKYYNANINDDKQPVAPDIDSVNKLLAEVDAFALASHLFWTLWSIVNASKSQIPFGYWEYGLCRLDTYQRLKQEVIKKEQFGLPQKRKIEEVDI